MAHLRDLLKSVAEQQVQLFLGKAGNVVLGGEELALLGVLGVACNADGLDDGEVKLTGAVAGMLLNFAKGAASEELCLDVLCCLVRTFEFLPYASAAEEVVEH